MIFNSSRNARKKAGLHKKFRGSKKRKKFVFGRKQEKDKLHLVVLCIAVCSICAAAVGLASALGSFDITLNLRYTAKRQQEKPGRQQRKGYFRIVGK